MLALACRSGRASSRSKCRYLLGLVLQNPTGRSNVHQHVPPFLHQGLSSLLISCIYRYSHTHIYIAFSFHPARVSSPRRKRASHWQAKEGGRTIYIHPESNRIGWVGGSIPPPTPSYFSSLMLRPAFRELRDTAPPFPEHPDCLVDVAQAGGRLDEWHARCCDARPTARCTPNANFWTSLVPHHLTHVPIQCSTVCGTPQKARSLFASLFQVISYRDVPSYSGGNRSPSICVSRAPC